MKRQPRRVETLRASTLPGGPPLHLEDPGAATRHLSAFVQPERLARLREILARRTRHLTVLLERVHDPHNVAACLRTCDAFGVQDLHMVPDDPQSTRISRMVSRGAQRWVTVHRHDDTAAALAALRGRGYRVVATALGEAPPPVPVSALPLDAPLCIAFGNESDGVSDLLREQADGLALIPMRGFVESLNVSVAFAIALASLRDRLDALAPPPPGLQDAEAARILDGWIVEDVPRAREVLRELARRASLSPCPPSD
ncbi:MAG: RNA methyltransferase [Deltaproteobacteria bacterium]|nr:RNA methyltransferase [Deltaproteobacteria bacterium]